MNAREFLQLLQQPTSLTEDQALALRQLTEQYPYFAAARTLYAKYLHDRDDLRYTAAMQAASLSAPDRTRLKEYLERPIPIEKLVYRLDESPVSGTTMQHQDLIDAFLSQTAIQHQSMQQPEVEHTYQPVVEENANDSVLTESLARIYIKQKKYEKAIHIFEKLNLKYPEKSSYFADRIQEIEKLIQTNE